MTSKIMTVKLNDETLPSNTLLETFLADPSTGLVRLGDIYKLGNQVRNLRGRRTKYLRDFIRSKDTVNYLIALEEVENGTMGISHTLEFDTKGRVENMEALNLKYFKKREGRYGGTWVHPLVALEALGQLDERVRVLAYKQLYELNILGRRIESSEAFKKLNSSFENRVGKENVFKWSYKHFADAIRAKAGLPKPPKGVNPWNDATPEQLAIRTKIEDTVSFMLDSNLLKTREEVLNTIKAMEV